MKKESVIYVRLIEGAEAFVPVKAESKEAGIFTITENPYLDESDETSIWEFFPGDTVKCSKNDNGWFAEELLESSLPNRGVYKLVFSIVKNLGSIDFYELVETEKDSIERLCAKDSIPQRKHPVVNRWLEGNCSKLLN